MVEPTVMLMTRSIRFWRAKIDRGDIFGGIADDREDDDAKEKTGDAELRGSLTKRAGDQLRFPGGEGSAGEQNGERLPDRPGRLVRLLVAAPEFEDVAVGHERYMRLAM